MNALTVVAPLAYSRLPDDLAGWVIWGAVAVTCAWVLWKSVQWTIWPGEEAPDHVKRSILDDAPPGAGDGRPPPSGPPAVLLSSVEPSAAVFPAAGLPATAPRSPAPKAPA